MLAHNAARLRVPFDSARLFECSIDDPYVEFLDIVIDLVHDTVRQEQAKQEAEMRR